VRKYLCEYLRQFMRRHLRRHLRDVRRCELQRKLPGRLSETDPRLSATVTLTTDLNSEPKADWQPIYKTRRAEQARALAYDIALRFNDPDVIERAVRSARAKSTEPQSIYWTPHGVAQGDAGVALMYGCFDDCFPDQGWDKVAHFWVERAVRGAENLDRPSTGLFEGLSGLAFTIAFLSKGGRRYVNILNHLHEYIVKQTEVNCGLLDDQVARNETSFSVWDVIAGLTGTAAYFLTMRDSENLTPILTRLVTLCGEDDGLPHWRTGVAQSGEWLRQAYPEGHLNCGLAHGIPGPLALLSLAKIADVEVPGQKQAIDDIAVWLSENAVHDRWGVNWPSAVPMCIRDGHPACGTSDGQPGTHAGWCYGSPGVARALWLAGVARDNAAYRQLSIEAMRAVMRRPANARGLSSPALCHGLAGLLCITLRFRAENDIAAFDRYGRRLLREIEGMYEPDSLLGYRTVEPGGGKIDQAGLLDGAPGIAMALLAASTPNPPTWDRLFMLS
jgi:hypothetical protein